MNEADAGDRDTLHDSARERPGDPAAPQRRRRTQGRHTQERALRRREALLNAAADLLGEGGFAAATHRAVARRAGIPPAATTYYFASRDELLAQAFALLVQRELADMRASLLEAMRGESTEYLAERLAMAYALDRPRQLGLWELYLQAGRDPALQDIARAWTDGCDEIVKTVLERAGYACGHSEVRFVTTVLSGLWLEDIVEARPEGRERARDVVARALKSIS
ncbi:hypothetical protein Pth03_02940 [Planotetraspora thailandica]|uniref:HTH tetR-type domain-containing protein n=1 Tax=Planotetraspora thailandica TaxID=487172 RepID=A0A8J3XT86_9ACTN|nr:TetR family transcriptional regulator [Planotetraspora thailandica]GII51905.1 hypothetical protein Pth03_02940 [Planotetraspora thailandica]